MKKILIVDDEPDIVKLVSLRLKLQGYEVATASGGVEGLQKAKDEPPDLILLDVKMPDMDGYQIMQKLKEDGRTRSIPIIMLTGQSNIEDVAKAVQSGAVDYIVKPFESIVLLEKIRKAL